MMHQRQQHPPAMASMEGAYAEALESAAQRIQLASRDTSMSGSSGYQSDTEKSSGLESNNATTTTTTTTTTGQSSSSSSSSSSSPTIFVVGGVDGAYTESSSLTEDPTTSRFSRSSSNSLPSTSDTSSSGSGIINRNRNNHSTAADNISSSSSGGNDSFISDDYDDDDDVESEISFLEKKQAILERASEALQRDEAYLALRAHDIVNGKYLLFGSSLWSEARTILDALKTEGGMISSDSPTFEDNDDHEEDDDDDVAAVYNKYNKKKRLVSPLGSSIAFIGPPPTKRPKIDLSMVELVSSSDFGCLSSSTSSSFYDVGGDDVVVTSVSRNASVDTYTTPMLIPEHYVAPGSTSTIQISSSGHWMAQTMIYQISALAAIPAYTGGTSGTSVLSAITTTTARSVTEAAVIGTRNSSLDVLLDPSLGPLVISPCHQPFHNAIQLTTALGLTSSAQ
jgi:hypothetical protein